MTTAVTRIEKLPGLNAKGPMTVKEFYPLYDSYADTPSTPPAPRKRTSAFYPLAMTKRLSSTPMKRSSSSPKKRSSKKVDYAQLSLILGVVSAIGGAAYVYWKYKETQARHEYRNREIDAFHALQKSASVRPHATTGYGWE